MIRQPPRISSFLRIHGGINSVTTWPSNMMESRTSTENSHCPRAPMRRKGKKDQLGPTIIIGEEDRCSKRTKRRAPSPPKSTISPNKTNGTNYENRNTFPQNMLHAQVSSRCYSFKLQENVRRLKEKEGGR